MTKTNYLNQIEKKPSDKYRGYVAIWVKLWVPRMLHLIYYKNRHRINLYNMTDKLNFTLAEQQIYVLNWYHLIISSSSYFFPHQFKMDRNLTNKHEHSPHFWTNYWICRYSFASVRSEIYKRMTLTQMQIPREFVHYIDFVSIEDSVQQLRFLISMYLRNQDPEKRILKYSLKIKN